MATEERQLRIYLANAGDKAREWTENRDNMIREAKAAGWSLRAIGEQVGLSHTAVRKIVTKGLNE